MKRKRVMDTFNRMKDEVCGDWRFFSNEELGDSYISPTTVLFG
jgi:hypothetical protein